MSQEKADIFIEKMNIRIEMGEFDKRLSFPFASRKLLRSLIKSKLDKKVETGGTPILSENNIEECIQDVRETAVFTTALFLEMGVMEKIDGEYRVTEKWEQLLKPT